jgi:Tfp pilus assembly protein FimT
VLQNGIAINSSGDHSLVSEGSRFRKHQSSGFSIIEILVVLMVAMIMSAMAIGPTLRSIRNYRLNSTASEVANMLQRTRYEAIKRNTAIDCRWKDTANTIFIDVNKNNAIDSGERVMLMPNDMDILGSAPSPNSMNYSTTPQTRPANGLMARFDARGTVNFGASAPAVYVVYLGFPGRADWGFRAVTLTPTGQTKIWSAPQGGPWHLQ